ncbi:ABC transporter ATP-binding protein [Flexibacterium corallicola]|uniref:ABC transporter ATP-binding protein n=1 Tax=Flexibacterium corallicola TaxID=3037259 RepID=UPI00286F0C65|nr:ABC transporter ATP-binding protein [Pseudovibrio sp. M1P-2-3]
MPDVILETKGICKSFGALKASDNISLDVRAGEIHALIGPNGAGKSTLIKQLAGSLKPDRGSIHFLGQDVTGQGTVERARMGFGRTFQVSALPMDFTVLENVVLGAMGASKKPFRFFKNVLKDQDLLEQAHSALERVGLEDVAGMRTSEVSHGQRRQLEVAVALTAKPKLFLMDEPMAGVGAEGSKHLTELLSGLRQEAPILLVEHDMEAVFQLADRISVLVYGQVISSGSAADIKGDAQVRKAYLGEDA